MEKKLNLRATQAKCLVTSELKKDTSAKSRNGGRRRELTNSSNSKSEPLRNSKPISTKTRINFDKRPRPRGYHGSCSLEESTSTRLDQPYEFEAEMNSVFLPGAKKQSLNHLLNFHYAPRDRDPSVITKTGNNRSYNSKKNKYNKEQYLQANCQFVVKSDGDYSAYTACPDLLVEWNQIEQIINHSSEEPQCPICLYPPVASKMTKCGHIFCWPCVLHYLALSDKTWRKCPICYESVHIADLKSAVTKPYKDYNVGDFVDFILMRREKESLGVSQATSKIMKPNIPHLYDNEETVRYSKLVLANKDEIMTIVERERNELKTQLCFDGEDPESMFIHQALDLLLSREKLVFDLLIPNTIDEKQIELVDEQQLLKNISKIQLNELVPSLESFGRIDEEANLYCQDMEMIPETNDNSQFYFFYQASDGQQVYLDSINIRMLHEMYGSIEKAPHTFRGKILQKYSCSMTEEFRKRSKYLHLPVTCQFDVVEVQFDTSIISAEVLNKFKGELNMRKKLRQRRAREELIREKHIFEVNERQLGKVFERSSNIDIDSTKHFPKYGESFEDSYLFQSPSVGSELSSESPNLYSGTSFANMLNNATNVSWPTIAPVSKYVAEKLTGTKQSSRKFSDEDDYDSDNYSSRLALSRNFSSAIADAILKATPILENKSVKDSSRGGKKKKNKKKTVLFSTGLNNDAR